MKLTVIVKDVARNNWCMDELVRAAKNRGVLLEFVDFKNIHDAEQFFDWGDIVLSRNTLLDKIFERPFFLRNIEKSGALMINKTLLNNPMIVLKSFQQKIIFDYISLVNDPDLRGIRTFVPNSIEELSTMIKNGELQFPFVEKPNFGAQGRGMRKIEKIEDVESVDGKIFQNFIHNDGDFRILCLGGKVLGIIKRIAKKGDFRNNISQGGSVEVVEDRIIYEKVSNIALKVASIFDLDFCGVDIIYDQNKGQYFFLEINTHPWWEGFQSRINIDVADLIIQHCLHLNERKKNKDRYALIKKCYQENSHYLFDTRFHYASRTFLYLDDKNSEKELLKLKDSYLGSNDAATDTILARIFATRSFDPNEWELRRPLFKKYDLLEPYTKIFFKVLFADAIYHQNIRPLAVKYLDYKSVLDIKTILEKNEKDMAALSTYAINFIYCSENYLFKEKRSSGYINPEKYYDIALNAYSGKLQSKYNLRIYFLTHCILGESRFYSRKITRYKSTYIKMIKLAEEIIGNNYFDIDLDNKLEFLVCARILGYNSNLDSIINSEAQNSLSSCANYLVDKYNKNACMRNKTDLRSAEHRNVLYLMAFGRSPRFCK